MNWRDARSFGILKNLPKGPITALAKSMLKMLLLTIKSCEFILIILVSENPLIMKIIGRHISFSLEIFVAFVI